MPGSSGPHGLRWDLRLFVGQEIDFLTIITVDGTTLNQILAQTYTEEATSLWTCEWVVRESADYDSTLLTVTPTYVSGGRWRVQADRSLVTWQPGRYEHMFRRLDPAPVREVMYGFVDFMPASAR